MKIIISHSRGTVEFAFPYRDCKDSCWWLINIDIHSYTYHLKYSNAKTDHFNPLHKKADLSSPRKKKERSCRNLFQFWGCLNEYCVTHVKALGEHTATKWTLTKLPICTHRIPDMNRWAQHQAPKKKLSLT